MTDPVEPQVRRLRQDIQVLEKAITDLANIPAAQAPLREQLAQKQQQLAALTGEMPLTGGSATYQSGGINFGIGNRIGSIGEIIAGDKISGDKIGGDKIGGDKITVGDISGSNGVAIGRGASANVSGGPINNSQTTLFQRVYHQIDALPEDSYMREKLIEQAQEIEAEVRQGDSINLQRLESQLRMLARQSSGAFEAVAAALLSPQGSTTEPVRTTVRRMQSR